MKVNVLDQIRSVIGKKLKFPNFICIIRISDISLVINYVNLHENWNI